MTRYQRSIMNKLDAVCAELQEDWIHRFMSRSERTAKEAKYRELQKKLNESYERREKWKNSR